LIGFGAEKYALKLFMNLKMTTAQRKIKMHSILTMSIAAIFVICVTPFLIHFDFN
jgi:hypothetical protein